MYNPATVVKPPKSRPSLPSRILTIEELNRILAVPNLKKKTGLRDRAMLELFTATGMRRQEVVILRLKDILWEKN